MNASEEAAQIRDEVMCESKNDVWIAYGRLSYMIVEYKRQIAILQRRIEKLEK